MFDIGFAELIIIAIVGLLVIGPERLPSTLRTLSLWLARFRRSFNDIKREIEQEMHNDAVMQDLRKTGQDLKEQAGALGESLEKASGDLQRGLDAPAGKGTDTPVATDPQGDDHKP
jgi:sec-independent protein translocase protein TatB